MPLARIDLVQGKSAEYRRTVGDIVYEAMVEALKAPKDDRFQVIAEHPIGALYQFSLIRTHAPNPVARWT